MTTKSSKPSDRTGLDMAIAYFGSMSEMARQLDLSSYAVVQQWRYSGRVPAEYCPKIEQLTNGAVRCEELNDKVDWAYLRQHPAGTPPRLRPSLSAPEEGARGEGSESGGLMGEAA